jgi:hypothetical protein
MAQLHKRFTDEQVKMLLRGYCQGLLTRAAVQDMLAISKGSFLALLTSLLQPSAVAPGRRGAFS